MKIYVDIDNTICKTKGRDYRTAIPLIKNIAIINKLYKKGHTIVYWTARGSIIKDKDVKELTEFQLESWGCLYHELKMGKEPYDMLIDDRAINAEDFFTTVNKELL